MLSQAVPLERVRPGMRPVAHSVNVLAHMVEVGASREVLRAAADELLRLLDKAEPAAASDTDKKEYSLGLR